ncbi:MAG TPA: diaminopimelate epimerase [Candidatus Binatia bacterium]|nr:diaminopimelate epimerase [Candidatus Binatia bacterium]
MRLPFTKMHGISNDYIYVNAFTTQVPNPAAVARKISDRRTGIGGDGLILICPSSTAHARMEMYNADGSRGEMCGNGIRCVGKYVYDRGLARANPLKVDTDAGVKTLFLELDNGKVSRVTVDMGEPILDGPRIPVAAAGQIIDQPLEVDGKSYQVTCLSMGNPHCVTFVDVVEPLELEKIGPRFEHHPFFPKRVNTEFIQVVSPTELNMRVWERGSGETWACGTGACAAAVAAVLNRKAGRRVTIHLRGGDLEIEWRAEDNHVYMTGPAEEVFEGTIET